MVMLFNIPAQPLKTALLAYSNVVGNQIIYDARLAEGRQSQPVVGLFAPETALRLLIEGTDLTVRYTSPRDVTLVATGDVHAAGHVSGVDSADNQGALTLDTLYIELPPGSELIPDFTFYGQTLRLKIKWALAHDSETAYRTLNVRMDIWIGANGHVENLHLLHSSGHVGLDAAILRVIGAIVFEDLPPKGMPQPIRVTILGI